LTATTRLALLVLTIGFLVEGVGEVLEFTQKTFALQHGDIIYLFYAGPASTAIGFLCAFIGRHEWSELHRRHVLHAHRVLAIAVVMLIAVVGSVFVIALDFPTAIVPVALPWTLGIIAAVGLGSSFVSYLLIAYHLTSPRGKALLGGALAWAALFSAVTGYELATHFSVIITDLHQNPLAISEALNDLTFYATLLFISYFLLTLAYHDAYRQLQKGVLPKGHVPAVRPPPKSAPPAPSARPPPAPPSTPSSPT
jgi:hypothetical protein